MIIFVSLLISLLGVLMYALAANPKLQEIGRLSFAIGLLVFLWRLAPDTIHLLAR